MNMSFNTGNPLGSKDILDLYDNSENIDHFANSQEDDHPDRFGTKRLTLAGLIKRSMALRNEINDFSGALTFKPEWSDVPMNVSEGVGGEGGEGGALNLQAEALGNRSEINKLHSRKALRRTYLEAGLSLVPGSFEVGGTLNSLTDILLEEKTGKCYSWSGSFPKVVEKNTNPSADNNWVERDDVGRNKRFMISTINSGTVTVNPESCNYWKVPVTEPIINLVINPVNSNNDNCVIELVLFFNQPTDQSFQITLPNNIKKSIEQKTDFLISPKAETHIRLISIDKGKTWKIEWFNNFSSSLLPIINDENASFIDEGVSTAGWTGIRGEVTLNNNTVKLTKTSVPGENAGMSKPMVFTPLNKDFILYGKIRASKMALGDTSTVWFLNGTKEYSFWLGNDDGGSAANYYLGSSSFSVNDGTRKTVVLAGNGELNYETEFLEFALQYDSKFKQTSCWFKQASGNWVLKARLKHDFVSPSPVEIQLFKGSRSPIGSWVEFDYLMLCSPNIISIGDSICEGKQLFSPNLSLNLSNHENTWQYNCHLLPNLRNNLIVNKGVGGESSGEILNRISEVTTQSPRLVLIHASTNDVSKNITSEKRTENIQNTINAVKTVGSEVVLLNALYGTKTAPDNTPNNQLKNFMMNWWENESVKITGVRSKVNIMTAINDSEGFMDTINTSADGLHPNAEGYRKIGAFIAIQ